MTHHRQHAPRNGCGGARPFGTALIIVAALAGGACNKTPTPGADDQAARANHSEGAQAAQSEAPRAAAKAAKAGVAAKDAYELAVTGWEGPTGEEGFVTVSIEAKGAHKINVNYPQKVTLEAPASGLTFTKQTFGLQDGQLEDEQKLVFLIPATATQAGEYDVRGTVKLSVCSEAQCLTEKQRLYAKLSAQ